MPEARRRVSDVVHDRLRSDILSGALAPGDAVPSERALAEELGVNRHAVREALKRLEQAGLVRISQGGATKVLDWRDSGGLEVLLDLVGGSAELPPAELVRSVLEVRATIGVDAARRCAERGDDRARAEVRRQAELTADAIAASDAEATDERYAQLWRAVVNGSGNVAYRLALNSLVDALDGFAELAAAVRPRDGRRVRALGDAVAAADPAQAARCGAALLEPDIDALA
jgi:GntR family transcriptional regulator, transcriptional repressor for pyruvate dehydrogenase complex